MKWAGEQSFFNIAQSAGGIFRESTEVLLRGRESRIAIRRIMIRAVKTGRKGSGPFHQGLSSTSTLVKWIVSFNPGSPAVITSSAGVALSIL